MDGESRVLLPLTWAIRSSRYMVQAMGQEWIVTDTFSGKEPGCLSVSSERCVGSSDLRWIDRDSPEVLFTIQLETVRTKV